MYLNNLVVDETVACANDILKELTRSDTPV